MQASEGGALGTPAEAAQTKAWPSYEAEYLQKRLKGPSGKYHANLADGAARSVYLDKVTENYKTEADECLKAEFKDWLEGRHEANTKPSKYKNEPGAPVRRYTYHTDIPTNSGGFEKKAPGDPMEDEKWDPTWWGRDSLTHLPGVREFLRGERKAGWENDFQMNMLAEHGPQDVEQAWQYFKHWVKKRPISDSACAPMGNWKNPPEIQNAGRVGTMPHHMRARPSIAKQDPPEEAKVEDGVAAAAAAAAAAGNVHPGVAAAAAAGSEAFKAIMEADAAIDNARKREVKETRKAQKENKENDEATRKAIRDRRSQYEALQEVPDIVIWDPPEDRRPLHPEDVSRKRFRQSESDLTNID